MFNVFLKFSVPKFYRKNIDLKDAKSKQYDPEVFNKKFGKLF